MPRVAAVQFCPKFKDEAPLVPFGIIYLITNMVTGKVYVGQTTLTLARRWSSHQTEARSNPESSIPLHAAIRKYGSAAFTVTVLEECFSRDTLNLAERKWIKAHSSTRSSKGYNCTEGGDRDFDFTQESKSRIAASVKKRWDDPSYRSRVTEAATRQWTPEKRALQSKKNRDRMRVEANRQHLAKVGQQYMLDHPEARTLLSTRNRTPEGRKVLSESRKRYLATAEARTRLSQEQRQRLEDPVYRARNDQVLAAARAARTLRPWLAAPDLHELLQGLNYKSYESLRSTRRDLPCRDAFPRIYGKTFAEMRDGTVGSGRGRR